MFCENCGHYMEEGQSYCPECGWKNPNAAEPLPAQNIPAQNIPAQNIPARNIPSQNIPAQNIPGPGIPASAASMYLPPVKKKKGGSARVAAAAAAGVLVLAAAAAAAGGFLHLKNMEKQRDQLIQSIASYRIPACSASADDAAAKWEQSGILDFSGKKELLISLQQLETESRDSAAKLDEYQTTLDGYKADMEKYRLTDSFSGYEQALADLEQSIQDRDAVQAEARIEDAKLAFDDLIEDNNRYAEEHLSSYENLNLANADASELQAYDEAINQLETLLEEGEYSAMPEVISDLDQIYNQYVDPETALNVTVQQVDASEFPHVKLYAQFEDPISGQVPENLDQMLFYIRKQDATGDYVRQTVTRVTQLDEQEALSVDMVADVSSSMQGGPIQEAKAVMNSFIGSVQFDAGDTIELTAFSTGVYLVRPFCSDPSLLMSDVNNLSTDSQTSLYDALLTAVNRVAARTGARCVIAFTDGQDNYSSCSAWDVINLAQRYRVPVFIIGIGQRIDSDVVQIAGQTGGGYYNISDVSSLENLYQEIYRQEKEMYLLEFDDSTNSDISDESNIVVGYHSPAYGGECSYRYTPQILTSVTSDSIYTTGPEAVIEGYLKNFDDAMTEQNFAYIAPYLKTGSNIYNTQRAYVTRGISEMLDSYEIVDVSYSDSFNCVVTTRETFYVQKPGQTLSLLTQQCRYAMVMENNSWKMTDFADQVQVLLRIKQ